MTSSDIQSSRAMYLPRMSVPTRGRGKTICSLCHLSLRNSFAARSVCLCRRKWTREATLMYQPRVPRRLSLVTTCVRLLALRHQSLTFCARLSAKRGEKRSARGGDCWCIIWPVARYPNMLNFAVHNFFCLPQLLSTAFNRSLPGQLTPTQTKL